MRRIIHSLNAVSDVWLALICGAIIGAVLTTYI